MKTGLDCLPCFIRQALEAVRRLSDDPVFHERVIRRVLDWARQADLEKAPPVMGQHIHRLLRELTGVKDPYRAAKEEADRIALSLFPELKERIKTAPEPLDPAVRLAITGNVMDLGVTADVSLSDLRRAIAEGLAEPIIYGRVGDKDEFREAIARARHILYLADNAGEIVFDRLLIEVLGPARVTLAVRGFPVLNDATMADAQAAGLTDLVEVVTNGSDAPGTILEDCNADFVRLFHQADLIIAKGQGNYESLSDRSENIFFLFKIKCPVIAAHAGSPVGSQVVMGPSPGSERRIHNKNKL